MALRSLAGEHLKRRLPWDERHRRIIEAAIEVFGERGYRGTTTQLLAERAGVSEALLYQHFSSKRDLFLTCLITLGDEMIKGVGTVLSEGAGDPRKTLEELISRIHAQFQKRPEIGRFSLALLTELDDPEIRGRVRELYTQAVHLIARAIARGQERDLIDRSMDPEALAYLVVSFYPLLGLLYRLQLGTKLSVERLSQVIGPFLRGGGKPADSNHSRTPP